MSKGLVVTENIRITIARVLAIGGTILAGFPLAAPIVLSLVFLVAAWGLHLDYLMPGELAWVVLGGGLLLTVASVFARRRRVLVIASFAVAAVFIGLTAWLAIATGLGSGAVAPEGWPLALVVGAYAIYVAAAITLVVAGILLCRDLFRRRSAEIPTAPVD